MTARKEGLERSHPVIPLPPAEAARLLRPWCGDAAVESIQLLGGGLGNSNYLVRLAGPPERVVIRLHARGREPRDLELRLLQRLQGQVPVPRALGAGDDAVDGARAYAVLEHCPGKLLNDWLPGLQGADVEEMGRAVGAALAAIWEVALEGPACWRRTSPSRRLYSTGNIRILISSRTACFTGRRGRRWGSRCATACGAS